VVWIWDENNVDNILMFLFLASSQGLFNFSCWPSLPGAWEDGRGHN